MNLVFAWCVARIDPEKREQWEIELSAALPGQIEQKAPPTPFQADDEAQAFMATMAMHQAQARTRTPA